jgi:NADH-quinone oxidoreductase subunit L
MLIGLAIAYNNYIRQAGAPAASSRSSRASPLPDATNGISTSSTTSCSSARRCGSAACSGSGGDEGTIDRFGPHGAAYAVGVGNRLTARLQSGYLYSYALVMLLGLIGARAGRSGGRMSGCRCSAILIALPLIAGVAVPVRRPTARAGSR